MPLRYRYWCKPDLSFTKEGLAMENNQTLVPRNIYTQAVVRELNDIPYDPKHHNGKHNPYSKKIIISEEDYEEYVREYVYYRLCDEIVVKKYAEQLIQNTQQFEAQKHAEIHQINAEHEKQTKKHRRRWLILTVCIALAITLYYTQSIPEKERASYESGHEQGLLDGYDDGREEGLHDGYETGYQDGHEDGYDSGKEDGFQEGTDYSGFDAFTSGYEHGYKQAVIDAYGLPNGNTSSSSSNSTSNSSSMTRQPWITEPKSWVALDRIVYASERSHTIHLNSGCSGMRNYFSMTYGDACAAGYAHCRTCF